MPSHSARVRTAPLPEGYQFGDARPYARQEREFYAKRAAYAPPAAVAKAYPWRAPHLNAAEQLQRRAGWNVIEGEHFESNAERHRVIEGAES